MDTSKKVGPISKKGQTAKAPQRAPANPQPKVTTPQKKYRFAGTCVHLDGDLINDMKRTGRSMYEEDFHDQVDPKDLRSLESDFTVPLKQDWHVSYSEGELPSGKRAIWFTHSNIEHVFTDDGTVGEKIEKSESLLKIEPDLARHLKTLRAVAPESANFLAQKMFTDTMIPALGNRAAHEDFMSRPRKGVHVSLDLNSLGPLNKVHGQLAGDEAIKAAGGAISRASRTFRGKAHHISGDEFRVWFEHPQAAYQFARQLHKEFSALPPVKGVHHVSASVGLGTSPEEADQALIHAKTAKKAQNYAIGHEQTHVHSLLPGAAGPVPVASEGPAGFSAPAMQKSEFSALGKMASITPDEVAESMRPHTPSGWEGYQHVSTYRLPDRLDMKRYEGVNPRLAEFGQAQLYHHVYSKVPYQTGYQGHLHAISVSEDPFDDTAIVSSASMGTTPAEKFLGDPWSAGKAKNLPWSEGTVPQIGETATQGSFQGSGAGTILYRRILQHHGRLSSDSSVSSGAEKLWGRLLKVPGVKGQMGPGPENVHYAEWVGEPNPKADAVLDLGGKSFNEVYHKSEEEDLSKGAMKRFPFNPQQDRLDYNDESDVAHWQGPDREARERPAPHMSTNARARALHKLSGSTIARMNKETGEREFLLHRGVGEEEFQSATNPENITHPDVMHGTADPSGFVNHSELSSWTPRFSTAKNFGAEYGDRYNPKVLSAWVSESAVAFIPKQYGALDERAYEADGYDDENEYEVPKGGNEYGGEHEVVVHADHNSRLATPDEILTATGKKKPVGMRGDLVNRGLLKNEPNLSGETLEMRHALLSLKEEIEAIAAYQQRIDATDDESLKEALTHNRDEEKEHVAEILRWIVERDPDFKEHMSEVLQNVIKNEVEWRDELAKADQLELPLKNPSGPKPPPHPKAGVQFQHPNTPEFHQWFGNSHVRDEVGKPMVVFHGSRAGFTEFDPAKCGAATDCPSATQGFFFSRRPHTAETYTDIVLPHEKEAHDKLFDEGMNLRQKWNRNISRTRDPKKRAALEAGASQGMNLIDQAYEMRTQGANLMPVYLSFQNPYIHDMKDKGYRDQSYYDIIQQAKKRGHDSVIIRNTYDAGNMGDGLPDDVYVAFKPTQIKSATANAGTFDPNHPDIRKSEILPTAHEDINFEDDDPWVQEKYRRGGEQEYQDFLENEYRPDLDDLFPEHYEPESTLNKAANYKDPDKKLTLSQLFRAYKNSPHHTHSLFLKYLVHRIRKEDFYKHATPEQTLAHDQEWLKFHAHEKNANAGVEQLYGFLKNNPNLVKRMKDYQAKTIQAIKTMSPDAVKEVNGELSVALLRGMKGQRGREHEVSSWTDNFGTAQTFGRGGQILKEWVPLKDIWHSYDIGAKASTSKKFGNEDEFLVSPAIEAQGQPSAREQALAADITQVVPRGLHTLTMPKLHAKRFESKDPTITAEDISAVIAKNSDVLAIKAALGHPKVTGQHFLDALKGKGKYIAAEHPKINEAAAQAAIKHEDPQVRSTVAGNRGVVGSSWGSDIMSQAMRDSEPSVRKAAMIYGGPSLKREHVEQGIKDPDNVVRMYAEEAAHKYPELGVKVATIPPPSAATYNPEIRGITFDYSSHLPEHLRQAGYKIQINHHGKQSVDDTNGEYAGKMLSPTGEVASSGIANRGSSGYQPLVMHSHLGELNGPLISAMKEHGRWLFHGGTVKPEEVVGKPEPKFPEEDWSDYTDVLSPQMQDLGHRVYVKSGQSNGSNVVSGKLVSSTGETLSAFTDVGGGQLYGDWGNSKMFAPAHQHMIGAMKEHAKKTWPTAQKSEDPELQELQLRKAEIKLEKMALIHNGPGPMTVYRVESCNPQATESFTSEEVHALERQGKVLTGFLRAEDAVKHFGQDGIQELRAKGIALKQVQAGKVYRAGDKQVMYEPHKS